MAPRKNAIKGKKYALFRLSVFIYSDRDGRFKNRYRCKNSTLLYTSLLCYADENYGSHLCDGTYTMPDSVRKAEISP